MIGVTMADVLAKHRIRWALVPDPDYDERMPDVGKHAPYCDACGPMSSKARESEHQADALAAAGFGHIGAALDDKAEQEDS